jgi:ribosomal-protein-alanine N-acetyltransferase
MNSDPVIRELDYNDLAKVMALERRVFQAPWSLAMFVLELSKPTSVCLSAQIDGELAGYLICSRYETVWHIMNICVEPDLRRRGVASVLLGELLDRVGGDESRYTLEVRPSNPAAIGLYEHHGFLAAGQRRRYYADNGEDAIIMWRTPGTLRGVLDDVPNASPVQR